MVSAVAMALAVTMALPVPAQSTAKPVLVRYYGGPVFAPVVADVVAELNTVTAAMPRAPHFVFRDQRSRVCKHLPPPQPRVISVCTTPRLGGHSGLTWWSATGGEIRLLASPRTAPERRDLVCHEFVHVVGHALDGPYDQDSCMRGPLDHFGSYDIAAFAARFG